MKKSITLIGFGNQAKAWALNLRDSGLEVTIALKENSPSHAKAQGMGFKTTTLSVAAQSPGDFVNLTPDHLHHEVLKDIRFKPGSRLVFAHGYSIAGQTIERAQLGAEVLLLAPKAIASELRFLYETKGKIGAVYSVEFASDPHSARLWLKALAIDLGINAGPYENSFLAETKADLFSEQSLLCSVLPRAAERSFQLLIDKGISPELAYLECWYELKLIADTMVKMGPNEFFKLISPNALLGGYEADRLFFDKAYQEKLELLFERIENGTFFEQARRTDFEALREEIANDWGKCELELTHQRLKSQLFGD